MNAKEMLEEIYTGAKTEGNYEIALEAAVATANIEETERKDEALAKKLEREL